MNTKLIKTAALFLSLTPASLVAQNSPTEIIIDQPKKEISIQPNMYGIFFEDINFAADGGLYAEMVKNRSFEFVNSPLMGWTTYGQVTAVDNGSCFERNPHFVRLTNTGLRSGVGLLNEGFRGIGVEKGKTYRLSVYARSTNSTPTILKATIISSTGFNIANQEIKVENTNWTKYEVVITANETDFKAKLRIDLATAGTCDLEHISLFPTDTWMGHENGLRKDLAQALADLKPGVFRFPGGCIIEGNTLETRYQWKNSVGPVENRPINENRWNYTFQHRFAPDYFQTYGLGFFEFFQLCEEIGADPLPVISCGFACQFESKVKQPIDQLDCYIQDALDLIEFANGPATSTWGKVRTEMGHPKPFNLKMLSIGNEQWGEEFPLYLEKFIQAIRPKYPEIKLVGTAGPYPDGKDFDYLWKEMTRLKADLVDEHYYRSPEWFLSNANRYDNYDRKGPKVFAGEYACHDGDSKKNSFYSALCEAAFLTGIERNADIVHLATYAPLFAHVDAWQWKPDMIWYDNLRSVRSANWYVQQLYSLYKGTNVLSATANGKIISGENGLFASAVSDKNTQQVIVKIANTSNQKRTVSIDLKKMGALKGKNIKHIEYTGENGAENTLDNPTLVVPTTKSSPLNPTKIELELPAFSFHVLITE